MPKVSIVIPICNAEQYLNQCIESVLNQSLIDIEVVCVDDGSKDHSLQIINSYARQDSRIKIISKENSGYGNSVNRGIKASSGKYIGIVESDDFISPEMYEILWGLSENGSVDIVKGNFWDYYDWANHPAEAVVNTERKKMPDVENSFSLREYPDILWGHPSVWSAIYRREFLAENQISLVEAAGGGWVDNPFFFETLCCAKTIRWTKEPLYYYRKTNMNSSSNNQSDLTIPLKRMMENLEVLKKYNYNDEDILGFAYARALMYLCGVMDEKHYSKQMDRVRPYAQELMSRMNGRMIHKNFHLADQTNYNRFLSPLKILMEPSGKILIYNWIPFDNPQNIGGGVTIYCRNLIETILHKRPDIQIYFLSSGWAYDLSTTDCFIRRIGNIFGDRCRSFEIVNSPVPAPQSLLLNNPAPAFENKYLKTIISEFLKDYGPFDAVHFNNIEGLSLDVLDLKEDYPKTRFLYSLHNYVPMCITGFYYQRHTRCICSPEHTAQDCMRCTEIGRRDNISKEILSRAAFGIPKERQMPDGEWLSAFGFDQLDQCGNPGLFCTFTECALSALNRSMDQILAVSRRVKEIALKNGIRPEKTIVSYIGTQVAENQVNCSVAPKASIFKIAYLGSDYYFKEKGYPFLIDALASIDAENAANIDLLLTTTNGNPAEIEKRLSCFHSVQVVQGYTHADLKYLLRDVHLGIIPVLWEDNLPQIAIEMAAMGVPVLSSDCGGASELCDSQLFRFQGGNEADFKEHLLRFVHNPELLEEYWIHHSGLTTMDMHWRELEPLIQIPRKDEIHITLEQYALLLEENDFLYRNLGNGQTAEQYRRELEETRRSLSFRIGRVLTFIPRKVRGLVRCYHENGLRYTLCQMWRHISQGL